MLAAGERDQALTLFSDAIRRSDPGFRRRIAPPLLDRPDPDLRKLGLDALARAAAAGDAEDQYRYALALDAGIAGVPDRGEARRWFRCAADQGHAGAAARCRRTAALRHTARRILRSVTPARIKPLPDTTILQHLR